MSWPRGAREAALSLSIVLAVLAAFWGFADSTAIGRLEAASIDLRFRWRGALPPDQQVALVIVDDASLAALGRWPLDRHLFAEAVRALHRDGAKIIAFDVLFPELEQAITPSQRQAVMAAAAALPNDPNTETLKHLATNDPEDDLARAIKEAGNVLLPFGFTFLGRPGEAPDSVAASAFARFGKSNEPPAFGPEPKSMVAPVPGLADAAAGLGHVAVLYDVDGSARYDHAVFPFDGDFYPSLAIRAVARDVAEPWPDVDLTLGRSVEVGSLILPTDRAMRFLVNYRGPPRSFPTYSFVDLLHGGIPADLLAGRIVLIGGSFVGNADSVATPFSHTPMPGAERLANVITTILDRAFITEPSPGWWLGLRSLLIILGGAMGWTMARLGSRVAVVAGLVPLALWTGAAQLAFDRGILMPLAGPALALALAGAGVVLFRYAVADRQGRLVRAQFRRYLAPAMVDMLARHPGRLKLGGETRNMTFLFSDVRGFTTIAERYKSRPEDLTHLINRFLTPMTEIIMAGGGTIDKYMGDCIMAFWNAPLDDADHATHACEAALAMMAALEILNRELAAEPGFEPLRIGIGLNSGPCVVGNMGSDQRFDYSVLGDAVNLASRLEGQSKFYGVDIVIGEATRALAPEFAALELDRIAVKGKREPVSVFAILGDAALAGSDGFQRLAAAHQRMLERYRQRDWPGVLAALEPCRAACPQLAVTYDIYQERCREFLESPVDEDWDGVFVARSK